MVAVNAVARFTVQSLWLEAPELPPAIDFETNWNGNYHKRDGDKLAFQYFP
jgi:hypothetical protein